MFNQPSVINYKLKVKCDGDSYVRSALNMFVAHGANNGVYYL